MAFTDPPCNLAYVAPGSGAMNGNDDEGVSCAAFLEAACANLLQHTRGAIPSSYRRSCAVG